MNTPYAVDRPRCRGGGVILWIAAVGLAACAKEQPTERPTPPRAVAAIEQVVQNPARKLRIAGAAAAWKQETLSFQVGGRVIWVTEPEKSVEGPSVSEDFVRGRDGTVIARIDPERYESVLRSRQASLAAADAQRKATQQDLEGVLPQELAKADAELKRARENRDRMQRAVDRNAVAVTELTNAQAAFETALAAVDSVRGQLESKKSMLEGLAAQVAQAQQAVRDAEIDLRDTELRAPFGGRITQVEVVPGALVQAGTPVAELVMMDPIKIEVTVSARIDREIGDQDRGLVYPRGVEEPLVAGMYQRDSVADSATRTVRLTLMCRNPDITETPPGAQVIDDAIPLIRFPVGDTARWFIERRCVHRDAEGTFAWRIASDDLRQITGAPFAVERFPIELGGERKDFVGLYQFNEILPSPELAARLAALPGITVREYLFAVGLPEGFRGGNVAVVRKAWTIRPGDIVDVQLDLEAPGPGVYVPISAVATEGGQASVYLVRQEEGVATLKRVPVTVSGRVDDQLRIADALIGEGALIVSTGTHVLRDGEQVQVTSIERSP